MIIYFYTLRYPEPFEFDYTLMNLEYTVNADAIAKFEENTIIHAKVYAVAALYDVPGLKNVAASALDSLLKVIGGTTREDNSESTPKLPMSFITELLRVVYETTPTKDRGLRDIIGKFVGQNRKTLLARRSVQDYALSNHSFGTDLLKIQLDTWKAEGLLWCSDCSSYRSIDDAEWGHTLLDSWDS
jgi:hypothetical protein